MKSSKSWLGRTFLVAAMFVAVPIWADEPVQSAELVYIQGKRLADEGQWEAALSLFKEAYAKDPSPKRAAHLGRAQVMTQRYAEGAANLERYLREEKDAPEDVRAAVEEMLREATTKVATVTLKIDARGAMLRIDKVEVSPDRWALPQYLEPKRHEFELSKEGFVTTAKTFEFAAGQVTEVELKVGEAVVVGVAKPITKPVTGAVDKRVVIGGGVLAGIALGTGIGALITYFPANEAFMREGCGTEAQCKEQYESKWPVLAGLTWVSALTAVGAVSAFTYAGLKGADSNKRGSVGPKVTIVPTLGGFVAQGVW